MFVGSVMRLAKALRFCSLRRHTLIGHECCGVHLCVFPVEHSSVPDAWSDSWENVASLPHFTKANISRCRYRAECKISAPHASVLQWRILPEVSETHLLHSWAKVGLGPHTQNSSPPNQEAPWWIGHFLFLAQPTGVLHSAISVASTFFVH